MPGKINKKTPRAKRGACYSTLSLTSFVLQADPY